MIVLDTCALVFWTLDPDNLSKKAQASIRKAKNLAISSISIWEIGIKTARGKLEIPISLEDYVQRLKKVDNLDIIPVDEIIWVENVSLTWQHRDPADRTIVATAKLTDSPLITSDNVIKRFYKKTVW